MQNGGIKTIVHVVSKFRLWTSLSVFVNIVLPALIRCGVIAYLFTFWTLYPRQAVAQDESSM